VDRNTRVGAGQRENAVTDYAPIGEHGLIGDLQTCALVASDGSIDWFCCPRFDSPSIFAALLDRERGGYFSIQPAEPGAISRQLYVPGTAIMLTRFMTDDGVGELVDFMPVVHGAPTDRHRIARLLRVVRGRMRFTIDCQPRFDYGRAAHKFDQYPDGVGFTGDDGTELALHVVRRENIAREDQPAVEVFDHGVRTSVELVAGEIGGIVLESAPDGPPRALTRASITELFVDTRDYWRNWIARSRYTGRWREEIERSAMTLKLLTYEPTGAPIAAATMGLPEQPGGERNWDYRYTWVRDGSFSVHALLGLGYVDEARAFLRWLADRFDTTGATNNGGPPLKIMYRVDGSSDLDEVTLDHFEGWRDSRPVRVGNGAADQLQLDIYGEAFDSLYLADTHGIGLGYEGWGRMRRVIEWLADNWDGPDEGIWETRGGQQHFTYGRLMSWVAFDRALRIAQRHSQPADLAKWITQRDAIYEQIMTKGWNADRGAFVQHYATNVLDASLLYMPFVGFIAPSDPRWQSTLRAMDGELVSDSLVYRYDPSASPDGLRGHEGTFSICTFWYVDALARSGRLNDARLTFEKMLTYANFAGLFAEEIGPTGEQLGNFPQAFSHLSLISAAINLDAQLDRAGT
jgi:GH15 family glucan-1,4-alpha-glucosidase